MTSPTETPDEKPKASTKTAWKKNAIHEGVRLPSGAVVSIRIPNLSALLKAGSIPNDLVDAAIQFAASQELTADVMKEGHDFLVWAVPRTVVDPKIDEDEVDDLPAEDLELLATFIGRTNDVDAVGHHLGGLHTNAEWRRFRGIVSLDEIAAGLPGGG